jgi:NAD(P) transhydrogenase subunit alpha
LETQNAEDSGGYARAQDEAFYRKQRELLAKAIAESDVVITTANVPGRKAPILVTDDMVRGMEPGAVIVDLAAERGGNCELTEAGVTVEAHGVRILGPVNIASLVPFHASQMYANNITAFLRHLVKEGKLAFDLQDEITRETLVVRGGEIVHPRVLEALSPGSH